jgi:hypothetical protein
MSHEDSATTGDVPLLCTGFAGEREHTDPWNPEQTTTS